MKRHLARVAFGVMVLGATVPLLIGASGTTMDIAGDGGQAGGDGRPATTTPFVSTHPLAGVGAIIEATITATWQSYSSETGPRTWYGLEDVVAHAGEKPSGSSFSQLGGLAPDGRTLVVSSLPQFVVGERYVLFLTAAPWVYTPVWFNLSFHIVEGRVFGPNGRPVVEAGVEGIRFGESQDGADFSEPGVAVADFTAAMSSAAQLVGAPLGASVSLDPSSEIRWDRMGTTPFPTKGVDQ